MTTRPILEIAVESLAAAQAAERAGADRIELCADLCNGGLTPSFDFMRQVRTAVKIPIHAIIRPRSGDFVYSVEEIAKMRDSIVQAREAGMNGIVLGVLCPDATVDVRATKKLISFAHPLDTTFHRAFDKCTDLPSAVERVIACGAKRILSSGGAPDAWEGLKSLQALVKVAGQRIIVMPGGGINPKNFDEVRRITRAEEFHTGLGSILPYGGPEVSHFELHVRQMAEQLQ